MTPTEFMLGHRHTGYYWVHCPNNSREGGEWFIMALRSLYPYEDYGRWSYGGRGSVFTGRELRLDEIGEYLGDGRSVRRSELALQPHPLRPTVLLELPL